LAKLLAKGVHAPEARAFLDNMLYVLISFHYCYCVFVFVAYFPLRRCVMTRVNRFRGRYVSADDFRDLRKSADLTRKQAADVLDVAVRTIQNWETGGARIPWMAFRMLHILTGYALPGNHSLYNGSLYNVAQPNGNHLTTFMVEATWLRHN
jgi:DNA-binding XRE family transcriptional regulator